LEGDEMEPGIKAKIIRILAQIVIYPVAYTIIFIEFCRGER